MTHAWKKSFLILGEGLKFEGLDFRSPRAHTAWSQRDARGTARHCERHSKWIMCRQRGARGTPEGRQRESTSSAMEWVPRYL